ncbi:hypothetical protein EB795_00335 [Pseudomonas mandelii]|nr:hypothetical protein [Pseudomonas mandelii]
MTGPRKVEGSWIHKKQRLCGFLWRGSLLPPGCAAVVNPGNSVLLKNEGVASQPSGSKRPRHRKAC